MHSMAVHALERKPVVSLTMTGSVACLPSIPSPPPPPPPHSIQGQKQPQPWAFWLGLFHLWLEGWPLLPLPGWGLGGSDWSY